MFKSTFIIRTSALFFGNLCVLASLGLCLRTPEGALFLFIIGCSWLGLSLLASTTQTPEENRAEGIPHPKVTA